MWTLLKTPYLHGSPWIILLTYLMAALDYIRGDRNLGQFPMWMKVLYLRVFIFQFSPIEDPAWRQARREAWHLWIRRTVEFKMESIYHRTQAAFYMKRKYGRWMVPIIAGGATRLATASPLFYTQSTGGLPVIQDMSFISGNVFFVDVNAAVTGTRGDHPDKAIDDIDEAHNLCTANQGDSIFVLPGHAETISGAGGVTVDTAGVSIIGQGRGGARPLITFSAVGSTLAGSAASGYLFNIVLTSSFEDLVTMLHVTAADWIIDAVDVLDAGAGLEVVQFLLTDTNADRIEIMNCHYIQSSAADIAQKWISLIAVVDAKIHDNVINVTVLDDATSSVFDLDTGVRRCFLWDNHVVMLGGGGSLVSVLLGAAAATGQNSDSTYSSDVAAITTMNAFPGGHSSEVYCERVVDKSGVIDPVKT